MIEICKLELCTGCSLCATMCAKKSITMQTIDNFGHLYPVINQQTCVDCGLCQKVCPSLQTLPKQKPLECYAAWAKDSEDYKSSASGGAASVLSQHVIKQGGVVYGCAMLPDVEVKHICVDNAEGLSKLKGSKYVQSNISEVLPLIRADVKEGKLVLFTGTPCQCGAVKNLFKQQPENLILVDLICHGVPSLKSLQQHVINKVGTIHADKVLFRDGNSMCVVVVVDGEIRYRKPLSACRFEDIYFNAFFDGYTYRESCYACQYAKPERAFDITIGDFWGLGKRTTATEIPEHPNGCSVILPSSEKGVELIKAIKDSMNLYPREVDEAINGNKQLQHPFKLSNRIKVFRKLVKLGMPLSIYRLILGDQIVRFRITKLRRKI